ncbi:hypothetical protein EXU48_10655 [Occultella glacieicola]|uniref:Transporter n=1 Tax=Occultella glacieicola TaxID=2518684 RepID=A0ABY2E6I8_9MICO|nr:hypothetical protein [Occultella glacieicola]TDE93921.1 hypothetical protein EXU48_10655 [Occultella glacieicola]
MVALFVRLRLTLMANSFKRSVWQLIGFILAALYAAGLVVMAVFGTVVGVRADPHITTDVVTIVGAVTVLAWWVVPLFAFGVDATLDPQRLVTYGVPRRSLLAGLTAAGLTSVPGFAMVALALGMALAWVREPATLLAALVGGALAVALCVVGSRAITTALAPLLESRRYREVLTIAAFVPIMLVGPAFAWGAARLEEGGSGLAEQIPALLEQVARMAGWTPLGAPWGLAGSVHDGEWLLALARLLIAGFALGLLWWLWDVSLARSLVSPPTAGAGKGRSKGLGWFDRTPATPAGAVAARALTYWFRDPRYSGSVAVIPLLPVVLLAVGGGSANEILLILAPLTAWILGYAISADISYDSSAFALHVATGVSGRDDRTGRVLAVGIPGLVVVAAFAAISLGVTGRWDLAPVVLGASLGALGVSLGVSSVTSARLLYPTPKPGDSPFKQPQGAAMATMISQGLGSLASMVVSLPYLALAIAALLTSSALLGWLTLGVGVVEGVAVMLLGIRWGARIFDRRGPELLQQVMSYA